MTVAQEFTNLFNFINGAATDKALQQNLPLLTDALPDVNPFGTLANQITNALNGVTESPAAIKAALDALEIPGLTVTVVDADTVDISFNVSASINVDPANAAIDIGGSAVGLTANADFSGSVEAALNMKLSYDTTTEVLSVVDNVVDGVAVDELTLGLDLSADVNGTAKLGILDIVLENDPDKEAEIALDFGLDIASSDVADLDAADVSVDMNGSAKLDLGLRTEVSILPDLVADLVLDWQFAGGMTVPAPTVKFENVGIDIKSLIDQLADVFEPILGIFDKFPLGTIKDALTTEVPSPFSNVLSVFDADKVPFGGDGEVNMLDLAVFYLEKNGNQAAADAIKVFADALAIIQQLTGGAKQGLNGIINLGSFDVVGGEAQNFVGNANALEDADGFLAAAGQFADAVEGVKHLIEDVTTSLKDGLGEASGLTFPIFNDPSSIASLLLHSDDPNADLVTFVQYDLPALKVANVEVDAFFPVLGPIGINLHGFFSAGLDFVISYDSFGLTNAGDEFTPDDLLKGIKLTPAPDAERDDVAYIDSGLDAEAGVNLVALKAFIGGGLTGNVGAELKNDELRLTDLDSCFFEVDGKLAANLHARLVVGFGPFKWTLRKTLAETTLVEFNYDCDGDADLNTDVGKGLAVVNATDSAQLLLNAGLRAGSRSINGQAGTDDPAPGGETYRITNGSVAGTLVVSAFGINETYGSEAAPIHRIGGKDGVNKDGVNFGQGDDVLFIDAAVTQVADVVMGAGNDFASGGAGFDILRGEDGLDHLIGNGGDDQLFGGNEDDTLEGGAGADLLDGGDGFDQVSYENSAVGVIFNKGPDATGALVGEGGEAQGDRLISIEYIIGSNHNDILWGTGGNDTLEGRGGNDALVGGAGDDYLLGGEGADTLDGGADTGTANNGGDGTGYVTSWGGVRIDLITGAADGGDATGDVLIDMEHVQGSMFDDVLRGSDDYNRLDGWMGDDIIEGRGGPDVLIGHDGNDIIYAGAPGGEPGVGDLLSPGNGVDLLSYRTSGVGVTVNLRNGHGGGGDLIGNFNEQDLFELNASGFSQFENLEGSQLADSLTGDLGANTIWGLNGADVVNGHDGDDILIGGAGADTLIGGNHTGGGFITFGHFGGDWADYTSSSSGVSANLASGGTRGDALGDTFSGVENLRGSDRADELTGDGADNVIDPGLSFSEIPQNPAVDKVFGGGGSDTLFLDYSRSDYGVGVVGGFDGWFSTGDFRRNDPTDSFTFDGVDFEQIDRLFVMGTIQADDIRGGGGDDIIYSGAGDDTVYGGIGSDLIQAGDGNDTVFHGTDIDRNLLTEPYGSEDASVITLRGGAGIDRLSISLVSEFRDIAITGGSPDEENTGFNAIFTDFGGNTSTIAEFEILEDVITGAGKDTVTQLGQVDNTIHTGWDTDIIRPGLGIDEVDGGFDFEIGVEVGFDTIDDEDFPDDTILVVLNQAAFEQNAGDLLELDYSTVTDGPVVGSVNLIQSGVPPLTYEGYVNEHTTNTKPLYFLTNQGNYHVDGGTDSVDFTEIERLSVIGTDQGDVLVGTYDTFGHVDGFDEAFPNDSPNTLRGDDRLEGRGGNDLLIGNTGDDKLFGGDGDDVLCGESDVTGEADDYEATNSREHVDELTGGDGADLFVLGVGDQLFYTGGSGNGTLLDHAVIKDFDASEGDAIQLIGDADDYSIQVHDNSTFLYRGAFSGNLIAKIEGVTGFSLTADAAGGYIHYAAPNEGFPTPPLPMAMAAVSEEDDPPATLAATSGVSALATGWVTQTTDRDTLLNTLFGSGVTGLTTIDVSLTGEGRAFGTFEGDPFGLGSGIILSTGKVDDVDQPNESDGLFTNDADLSTDLGLPGIHGDTIQFTYTFEKAAGASVDTIVFDFIMFSEEFREYGGSIFNDSFKIMLNGVNLALLSNDAAANINNLAPAPLGPFHPDLILNPEGTGPVADSFRADAYTKTLQFAGKLQEGVNTLTIEVKDASDGIFDSGILVKGGTLKAEASIGGLVIGDGKGGLGGGGGGGEGGGTPRLIEGGACIELPITVDPGLRGSLTHPLIITITPSADLDVGNGPGVAKVVTINPGDPLTFDLCVQARNDGQDDDGELGTVNVSVESDDPDFDGLPIAPFLFEIGDAFPTVTLYADHKLNGATGAAALGDGVTIQGFDLNGNAAALAYGDGGVGVAGSQFGFKGEKVLDDEIDRRGGKSEKLVINFNQPASDISLTLGQLYAKEKKLGELVEYTAYEEDGDVIATGTLDPNVDGTKVSDAVWSFDLGLDGVARIELSAADLYRGGKAGKQQSDFNLQSLTYAPSEETATPDIRTAITGDNNNDRIDGTQAPHSQSFASDGMELIAGLGGKDKILGLGGNDILDGGKSKDKLRGGDGDDVLIGGSGKDVLTGGAGLDQFLFNTTLAKNSADKITDFTVGEDLIVLDDAVFRKLDLGALTSSAFFVGKEADDGDDRIIYNRKNGELIYDKNGDDKGGDTVFAILDKKLGVTEADFLVV